MLTLVAAVLVYDLAYEPVVDLAVGLEARDAPSFALSLKARSETREENDMLFLRNARKINSNKNVHQSLRMRVEGRVGKSVQRRMRDKEPGELRVSLEEPRLSGMW